MWLQRPPGGCQPGAWRDSRRPAASLWTTSSVCRNYCLFLQRGPQGLRVHSACLPLVREMSVSARPSLQTPEAWGGPSPPGEEGKLRIWSCV